MEKPRFQIGKLFKLLSWLILIAVPIGMYAMYYSNVQRNYFNQRNFRALNEVSNQFELHIQALEKLFLFVPSKFEPNQEEGTQTIDAPLEKVNKQVKELNDTAIQEGKELRGACNVRHLDQIQNINKLENLRKNLKVVKELLDTSHSHCTNTRKKITEIIETTSQLIYKINLAEQKRYSHDIYTRRLQSNDFMHDLIVHKTETILQIKNRSNYCEGSTDNTLFILNKNSTEAKLTAYWCKKNTNIEQLNELTDELEEIKKLKSEIETPEHSQTNIPYNTNQSGNLNTLKNKQKGLENIHFTIPVESLLGLQLPSEFDGILLSNNRGQVLVQKDIKPLHWDEKKTFLKMARAGASVSDISWLLKMAKMQIASKNLLSEEQDIMEAMGLEEDKDNKHSKNKVNLPVDLGHSTFVDLEVAGKEYRIYIHPFILKNKIYNENEKKAEPLQYSSKFYILGFVEKSKMGGLVFSLGFINIAIAFLLLFTGFLAWPFLKLNFMGAKEAITANDIRTLLLSLLFALVILTVFLMTVFSYNGIEHLLDKKTVKIANQIETVFLKDLESIINELRTDPKSTGDCQDLKMHSVTLKKHSEPEGKANEAFSCMGKKSQYFTFPLIRDVFSLNNKGKQVGPIIYNVERLFSSMRLNLHFRDYFKKPRDGETWHWFDKDMGIDKPFYIERIHNFSDGQKASQVSIPVSDNVSTSIASMDSDQPVVRASTTYFPGIAAPVLPASFQFAIIENASGEILYHSQDQKSFVENLYAESDYNHHLISHAQMRHEGEVEGLYHGRSTKFYISPLEPLPWSLVVYYDLGRLQSFLVKTAILSLMLYLPFLLLVLLLVSQINQRLVKNWDWLWPHHQLADKYKALAIILFVITCLFLYWVLQISGGILFLGLIVAVPLYLYTICFFVGNSNKSKKLSVFTTQTIRVIESRICPKSCRTIYLICMSLVFISFSVIPSISFFKDVFSVNFVNYSRINQINYAQAMQQRAVKLDQYSRMFYPLKFDKPDNSDFRFKFPEDRVRNQDKGIFWFKNTVVTGEPHKCNSDQLDHSTGPADILIDYLLKINLQFAQQHAVRSDRQDRQEGCWEDDYYYFTTEDSAGLVNHQIYLKKITLGNILIEGIAIDYGLRFFILLVISWLVWFFVLKFFSRKVFGIFIPEPVRHRNSLSSIQSEPDKNSYKLLIRGADKKFMKLLKKCHISEERDVQYLDVLTANFDYLPSVFMNKSVFVVDNLDAAISNMDRRQKALACLEELLYKQHKQTIHVFIRCKIAPLFRLINPQAYPYISAPDNPAPNVDMGEIYRWGKLFSRFDKHYCWEPLTDEKYFDFLEGEGLFTDQIELIRLVRAEYNIWPETNKICDQLINRIKKAQPPLLSEYQILEEIRKNNHHYRKYCELKEYDAKLAAYKLDLIKLASNECKIWPELSKIRIELVSLILDNHVQVFTVDQVLEFIRTHANAFYRNYWELCTRDERLALYQLATNKYLNPANQEVIEHLYRRGYIMRKPYFRISNQSFKHYILSAELIENIQDWENAATESVWESIKVPLFIILFGLTGLVLYIASDAFDITLGLLSGLLAFIPILLKGVNTVKGGGSAELNSD